MTFMEVAAMTPFPGTKATMRFSAMKARINFLETMVPITYPVEQTQTIYTGEAEMMVFEETPEPIA
jgi:hypothetical protein